jgi:hypothetical protein
MSESRYDRRTLLKNVLVGMSVVSAASLARAAQAQGGPPKLDEKDTLAVSLGYVHDAKKVDPNKVPQYKPGSTCANCVQLVGKEGEEWRPCNLFPGKVVNANGWCKVWAPKPK